VCRLHPVGPLGPEIVRRPTRAHAPASRRPRPALPPTPRPAGCVHAPHDPPARIMVAQVTAANQQTTPLRTESVPSG
jgi:hypothetical protein